jgi:hypothetical protein
MVKILHIFVHFIGIISSHVYRSIMYFEAKLILATSLRELRQ